PASSSGARSGAPACSISSSERAGEFSYQLTFSGSRSRWTCCQCAWLERIDTIIVPGPSTPSVARTSHEMTPRHVSSPVRLPPFQTLLDAHGRDVYRFLIASVGRLDADDCYQETWLAALRAYPALRDASNLRSWVLTIAHRKAIDHLRARA